MRAWMMIAGAVLAACRDEAPADAVFEPRCGDGEPVALMELRAGESVRTIREFDDARMQVSIGDDDGWTRTVLAPVCGGPTEDLGPELASVEIEDGVLLGCDRAGRLVQPNAIDDPAPLVLSDRCQTSRTEHGLLAYDGPRDQDVGALVRVDVDDTGRARTTRLLDDVSVPPPGYPSVPAVRGSAVFVRRPDDSVWRVEIASA